MLSRLRSTLLAWGGALILVVSASGLVAAASLVGDTPTTEGTLTTPTVTDTSATFVDLNGDGIDDACQDAVVADQTAADATVKAADTNADGTISVSESAHTDWVGGTNCNHGGYVSGVARASGDECAAGTPAGSDEGADGGTPTGTLVMADRDEGSDGGEGADEATEPETDKGDQADCSGDTQQTTTTDQQTPPAECQPTTPETSTTTSDGQAPDDTAPNAHGLAVSTVAQSDAVGGKNCNHGGAVSEAAKKDHGTDAHGNAAKHAGGNALKQPKSNGHRWGHNKP
jgi:hypothetical protein